MKLYQKLLFALLFCLPFMQSNAQKRGLPKIGVATSMENDSLLAAAGFAHIEEGARKLFAPSVPDTAYHRFLGRIRAMKLDLVTCNLFLPGTIRLTGREANEKEILGYVDTLMQRAREAGVKIIVFGSAGARKLQEGQDSATALRELIAISRKMADVAKKYDRIIAMENLNKSEDNFINSLSIVTHIAQAVNHPNFRVTVDIYHMLREGEDPASILAAAPYLVHCHIAEKEGRRAPGTAGQDFRPYLAMLKKAGYKGRITMECGWKNMPEECRPALAYLTQQLNEAYE
ncbi:sugar phosphate isomerase/epimerase family protein [Chitinophaga sp. NPDC101104]|uniref:sugar phosphate isomerase/epimerase family protein n=1 Tax=Chitinophaga sp. NPDC101104 TaxID=3390561 RepID=UPI003D001A53